MKTTIAAVAMLAASACASQAAAPVSGAVSFAMDGDGYYRMPVVTVNGELDAEKTGEQMAHGEIFCRQSGKTAEIGIMTGPDGDFIRFRCVNP